jgi:hypothetical protein
MRPLQVDIHINLIPSGMNTQSEPISSDLTPPPLKSVAGQLASRGRQFLVNADLCAGQRP